MYIGLFVMLSKKAWFNNDKSSNGYIYIVTIYSKVPL